jgi:hypothetical protein
VFVHTVPMPMPARIETTRSGTSRTNGPLDGVVEAVRSAPTVRSIGTNQRERDRGERGGPHPLNEPNQDHMPGLVTDEPINPITIH